MTRINKYLADQNVSTRRGADELIKGKKVFINGKLAVLGDQVAEGDKVEVRGAKKIDYQYFAYNKPIGVETASPKEGLFPIGRLDKASHGLLIVTNDGRITEALLSPDYDHEKEYVVQTKEKLRGNFKTKMEAGVKLEEGKGQFIKTKKCKVEIINDNTFKVVLTEGKKHQIRRMCSALFQEVADLKRTRIMSIHLGALKSGQLREITGKELSIFLDQVLRQS